MKEIDQEELKRIQIEILDYFDAFCRKNHIRYWLDYGTLLGAVRHKGYIPWDDDIDVAMLREDYEKAAKLFNKQSNGRYGFYTPFNNKDYSYPFGKILDQNTVLYEYGEKGIKTSVYVDVFVYDNAPDDKEVIKKVFKKRNLLGRVRRLKLPMRSDIKTLKKIVFFIGSVMLKPISNNAINKALDKNAKAYNKNSTSGNVCSFADPYDTTFFCVPKTYFKECIELEFEGKLYYAPKKYDEWLKIIYGDYMRLPPVEQRKSHHVFKAYYVNKENN